MRLFTRLASGRLRSRKGSRDDLGGAPLDASAVAIEPAFDAASLREENADLRARLAAAESQVTTLRARLEEVKGQRSSQQRELSSLRLKLQQDPSAAEGDGGLPVASSRGTCDASVQASVPWASHTCGSIACRTPDALDDVSPELIATREARVMSCLLYTSPSPRDS